MTNYFTHVPCEVMMLNGSDIEAVKRELFSRHELNITPLTHAIVFTKIDSDVRLGHIPEIEGGLVSDYMEYGFYFRIIDKKTGEDITLPSNWDYFCMKRGITGERYITIEQKSKPGGN